ncbi:MAG: hypothetical protein ABEJ98_05810 [Candidatus Nanohaloarchaea archaeon]
MSISMKHSDHDTEDENALVVVNPIHHAIGGYVDEIATLVDVYDGKTVRVSNTEYIDDPEDAVGDYDEVYLSDENGLDRVDSRRLSVFADTFDFAGGPLEDIAAVYHDVDRRGSHAYNLMDRTSYDYGAVASDGTVLEEDMERISDLLEWDEEATRARFRRHSVEELLDSLN